MGKRRKTRIPKAGPVPAMTQLKQLTLRERHHGESIAMWLEDKPQPEVAKLIFRNFNIDLGEEATACSLLSRWSLWWEELPKTEARNAFAEFLEEEAASGSLGMPPEQARGWVLDKVTMFLRASEDPNALLALAKELRVGVEGKTRARQGDEKIKIADRRTRVAERKLDAVDLELKKLRDPNTGDDATKRAAILDEVDRIMGLKKD